jgi:hypothetical protein
MGERVNRIEREFVLKSVTDKKLPVSVRHAAGRVDGVVSDVREGSLTVVPSTPLECAVGDPLEVYFSFSNISHTFSSRVVAVEGPAIGMEMPEHLYKSLERQFDRVRKPMGFVVSFRLAGAGSVDLAFPVSSLPADEPRVDAAFDPGSIKALVDEFNQRARSEASDGRIVMLRNRAPAGYEERILQATGKALWIASTEGDFPGRDPLPEPVVLTKAEIVQHEKDSGTDPSLIISKVADLIYKKRRDGIESELFWPLLYGRYFVGYLYIVSREGTKTVGRPLLEWVRQFARILVHSLDHNGYFEGETTIRPYHAEAVDLSASGLLFAHPDKDLYRKLLVHSDIQISLGARGRRMTIGSRIIRKFADRDRVYFALRFLEIAPEDFRYLYETLYDKPFDPRDLASETGPLEGWDAQ